MHLEKYREEYNDVFIRPIDRKDLPLFKHCSGGCIAVTPDFFESDVETMLYLHGCGGITVTDRT